MSSGLVALLDDVAGIAKLAAASLDDVAGAAGNTGDTPDELALSSAELEKQKVAGAIRTDLILSGEIMAISLAEVASQPILMQAAALAVVSVAMTVGVYGVVGLIVKMDDMGLHLA